jgi:glycosyltransferase involved in cell wall biosynthesis
VRVLKLCELVQRTHRIHIIATRHDDKDDAAADELRARGWVVELVPLRRWRATLRALVELVVGSRPLQVAYYDDPDLKRTLERNAEDGETVICCLSRMAPAVVSAAATTRVIDYCDSQALQYELRSKHATSPLRRLLFKIESRRMLRFERGIEALFDEAWITSESDRAYGGLERTRVIPQHLAELSESSVTEVRERDVVMFAGNLKGEYAAASLEFLIHELLPALDLAAFGRLRIVGSNPPQWLLAISHPRLEVRPNVPSVVAEYRRCAVAALPIIFGTGGLKTKVLEAFAAGCAVVTTPIGNKGANGMDGRDLFIRAADESFSDAVVTLLRDPDLAEHMGSAGRGFAQRSFGADVVGELVRGRLEAARSNKS